MKQKILYIEDEPFLGKIVKESLETKNFEVLWITDGAKVLDAFKSFQPDLCVLDIMLPNVDGYTLAQNIRMRFPRLPIIFLTAKTQTQDILAGFESGGTDYMRKPFSLEELIARINNQLKLITESALNTNTKADSILLGNYHFYPDKYELHFASTITKLSHREAQVLTIFAKNRNQTIDRKSLLMQVWGDDSFFNSRTLDVYIRKLRAYFSAQKEIQIVTLKGKGYHFSVP
jgi:DNA-binding response OmpR family regulator